MPKANDHQIGGSHWTKKPIQCWDYIIANGLDFLEGNVVKYVTRWRDKGGVEDLKKARHYLDKLIEVAESQPTEEPTCLKPRSTNTSGPPSSTGAC